MTADQDISRVVSASREIAAGAETIFELIADPSSQPRWDGNDNLASAAAGQRVRRAGDVFTTALTNGGIRNNHVTEFEEGRRIAWTPSEQGRRPPGHLWRWDERAGVRLLRAERPDIGTLPRLAALVFDRGASGLLGESGETVQ